MNLQRMVARVMRALPNVMPGVIGELDIIDMLNQGQVHLSRISSRFIVADHDVEADYSIVPMPIDMITLVSVYWKSDNVERELSVIPERIQLDPFMSASEPTQYYTKTERIIIWPTPQINGVVSILYVPYPTIMKDDADTPDMKGAEEYLVAYTLHKLHLEAGSPQLQLWEEEKRKEEYTFLQTSDQNYHVPINMELTW